MRQKAINLSALYICSALALCALVAYEPMRHNDFVSFDDYMYVTENQQVRAGLTLQGLTWAFTSYDVAYWHPLTWLSHMLDCELYGLKPRMHHLTNLMLHIANTLLLFLVLRKMTHSAWPSAFVAAIFAVHPLNVESVAWVAERKNVLSTLFWLLTMWAYASYAARRRTRWYLLALLFYTLGLLSKPMLVTLPFVMLLLDYWPLGRFQSEHKRDNGAGAATIPVLSRQGASLLVRLVREKIPFFVLSPVAVFIFCWAVKQPGIVMPRESVPIKLRIANALVSYVSYGAKMIWPCKLAVYYPYPTAVSLSSVLMALVLLSLISVLVLRAAKAKPYLAVGWFWYLGTLVPVIGLYQAGLWPAMADRWAYVPLIGLFVMIAWAVGDLATEWRYRKLVTAVAVIVVLSAAGICTRIQVTHWRNNLALFGHALRVTENNAAMHSNYGWALFREGRSDEAVSHLTRSLQINPHVFVARKNLCKVLLAQGNLAQAKACFRALLPVAGGSPAAYYDLGMDFAENKQYPEAIECFTKLLTIDPQNLAARSKLGIMFLASGKPADAITQFNEVLRSVPDTPDVHISLGLAYSMLRNWERVAAHWAEAVRLKPDAVDILNNLAWLLATTDDDRVRNPTKAVEYARRACELSGYEPPELLDTLAAAYAAAGRFRDAVERAEQALELARTMKKEELIQQVQKRLELYRAGRPYIEKAAPPKQ